MAMNHRITIKRPATGEDALGQPLTNLVDVAMCWADVRVLGGLETIKAGADSAVTKASIRIRYRTDVDEGMSVDFGGRLYKVGPILPDPFKQYMDMVCEAVK